MAFLWRFDRPGARIGRRVRQIEAAEAWSDRFGAPGVLMSRLLPVIRHLIGLPAGIVKMHYGWYSLATLVGSGVWCTVLAWVGVTAGQDEQAEKLLGASPQSIYEGMDALERAGVVHELTNRQRNKVWGATAVLAELESLNLRIAQAVGRL